MKNSKKNVQGKVNSMVIVTIVAFLTIAAILVFGYNAVISLFTAMANVEIGGVPFLVEGTIMVLTWAIIAIFYVYLGRKTNFYLHNKPSMVLITVAGVITGILVASWVFRTQEMEIATAMMTYRNENPFVFIMLNLIGAVCIGCSIGIGIGYYFFLNKLMIYKKDNINDYPSEENFPELRPRIFYDKKTENDRKIKNSRVYYTT